jgi:hypothetical protein
VVTEGRSAIEGSALRVMEGLVELLSW